LSPPSAASSSRRDDLMRDLSSKLPRRVRRLFRLPLTRDRMLRDADEEMAFHLAMRISEFQAAGMSEEEALAEALRRFGDRNEFQAHARGRAGRLTRRLTALRWLEECGQDVRLALRQFLHAPAFGSVVVLTLAVCIGATTAMYGVVRHLLLSPLPYPDGNRIVSVEERTEGDGDFRWQISSELYRVWAARSHTLEDFAGYQWGIHAIGEPSAPGAAADSIPGTRVTPSFLKLLRIRPALGRSFLPEDSRTGAPGVLLLGDSIWRSRFGGSREVIGQTVKLDGSPRVIIGVLPPGLGNPLPDGEHGGQSVYLPLNIDSKGGVDAFARLRPGVTSSAASRELDAILHTLPDTGSLNGAHGAARTAQDRVAPDRRHGVEVVFAAAAGLLLVACADVAGLLLIRGWTRRREFAIRQAIGAGRARLIRQLLAESLFLTIPAGALGVGVAWLGLRAVQAEGPPFIARTPLDNAALLWTLVSAVATALIFGVTPAILSWERSLEDALRNGGTRVGEGRAATRAHATLVIAQIALSLVFLATAAVLTRSFVALVREPIGYEPEGLYDVIVKPTSPMKQNVADAASVSIMRTLREALEKTPGLGEVAVGPLPLSATSPAPTAVEGLSGVRPSGLVATEWAGVNREYFRVARIALVRGRGFDADPALAAREIIINQSLARRLFPDRDPLGARLQMGEWLTVVGIAADTHMPGGVGPEFFRWQVYTSPGAMNENGGSLLVRTQSDSSELRRLVARAVERAGVGVKVHDVRQGTAMLEYAYRAPRFAMVIFDLFTVLAVALAAVGLFGIIAHLVARRTREIGIRVALGADPVALTKTIVGQSVRLVGLGCGLGLVAAYAAASTLAKVVPGVSGTEPVALIGSVMILIITAVSASVIPVRRALRVDPIDTLRIE
jgi:putative ABC transport system permease protein